MALNKMVTIFSEPELEFGYAQRLCHPRDGLTLFGPVDRHENSAPNCITWAILGTQKGIQLFRRWSQSMHRPAADAPDGNFRLWPLFPGFEAAFNATWADNPAFEHEMDEHDLIDKANRAEAHERCYHVVESYLSGIRALAKLDQRISVAICIVPDEVYTNCRPQSRIANPTGVHVSRKEVRSRKSGQGDLFNEYDVEQYHLSPDFRRQIKARAMEFDTPIQILRESTLRLEPSRFGGRELTPVSDRMWNMCTALYYKAGGKPWKLSSARNGVCYIGIAFRRADENGKPQTACCAAQMFLNTGDGIVFLGEYGPWYSPEDKQFRLPQEAARKMLQGVLDTYRSLGGKKLTEIFIHSRSSIGCEEFTGYKEACPSGANIYAVRVRTDRSGPRLFTSGTHPIARGAFWKISNSYGYLWASGYKDRLATYDGWEIPVPLSIKVEHGDAPVERVAQDILGLTKLNYNACRIGESMPVTVEFSDAVGEILISNPTITKRKHQFRYYI